MNKTLIQSFLILGLSVIFTGLGLAGGWFAASQKSAGGDAHGHGDSHEGHDHGGHEGHDHAGHDHGPAKPKISPQAAKNLGITLKEIDTQTYFRYRAVPAVVTSAPLSAVPLVAPAGGTVTSITIRPNAVVDAGTVVVTIVRDPLPRPVLTLTEEIIKPAGEQFHSSIGDLRRSLRGVEILKTELDRIHKFTQTGTVDGLAVLPKKNEIDLRYDLARAEQELDNAREKLRLHGISDEQLVEVESGKPLVAMSPQLWVMALKRNGLWRENAEALFAALPAALKDAPWTAASIGELAGAGLITAELTEWMKSETGAGERFLEIAGLLQQGNSLVRIKTLYATNALNPIIEVRAPSLNGVKDWDVTGIAVKPLDRVEAGAKLATLTDARQMFLQTDPVGSETSSIMNALKDGMAIEAVPLVADGGPTLKSLKIMYVTSEEASASKPAHGTVAFLRAENEPFGVSTAALADAGGTAPTKASELRFRTWKLRDGMRYLLRVPTHKMDEVYVVPSDAVTDDGPDKVVFIPNGDSYDARKVAVLHQDHEVAVLDSKLSDLFPGDSVVQHGAFGLGLALKAGSGAVDPHAGHNH